MNDAQSTLLKTLLLLPLSMTLFALNAQAEPAEESSLSRARAALAKCPESVRQLIPPDSDNFMERVSASMEGTSITVDHNWAGNGMDGGWGESITIIDSNLCQWQKMAMSGMDGQLSAGVDFSSSSNNVLTNPEKSRLIAAHPRLKGVLAEPNSPAHGVTRLIAVLRGGCLPPQWELTSWSFGDRQWELSPPVHRRQPELKGRPQGSPSTLWSPFQLRALGGKAKRDVLVFKIASPRRVRSIGNYDIYQSDLRGRRGGQAIAVYNHNAKTHRWVLVTRTCVFGSVRWLGNDNHLAVGVARCPHPALDRGELPFVVDLAHGTAHQLVVHPDRRAHDFRVRGKALLAQGSSDSSGLNISLEAMEARLRELEKSAEGEERSEPRRQEKAGSR